MAKRCLALLVSVLLAGFVVWPVQAEVVSYSFTGEVMDGPFKGDVGTGSFTYDNNLLTAGSDEIDFSGGLLITFSFNGQEFNQTHDTVFPETPILAFAGDSPVYLDYELIDGINGVNFDDPALYRLTLQGLTPASCETCYQVELFAAAVPIPGAIWLFGAGIAGLLGIRRNTKEKT